MGGNKKDKKRDRRAKTGLSRSPRNQNDLSSQRIVNNQENKQE